MIWCCWGGCVSIDYRKELQSRQIKSWKQRSSWWAWRLGKMTDDVPLEMMLTKRIKLSDHDYQPTECGFCLRGFIDILSRLCHHTNCYMKWWHVCPLDGTYLSHEDVLFNTISQSDYCNTRPAELILLNLNVLLGRVDFLKNPRADSHVWCYQVLWS